MLYIHVDHPMTALIGPFNDETALQEYAKQHVADPEWLLINTDDQMTPEQFAIEKNPPSE